MSNQAFLKELAIEQLLYSQPLYHAKRGRKSSKAEWQCMKYALRCLLQFVEDLVARDFRSAKGDLRISSHALKIALFGTGREAKRSQKLFNAAVARLEAYPSPRSFIVQNAQKVHSIHKKKIITDLQQEIRTIEKKIQKKTKKSLGYRPKVNAAEKEMARLLSKIKETLETEKRNEMKKLHSKSKAKNTALYKMVREYNAMISEIDFMEKIVAQRKNEAVGVFREYAPSEKTLLNFESFGIGVEEFRQVIQKWQEYPETNFPEDLMDFVTKKAVGFDVEKVDHELNSGDNDQLIQSLKEDNHLKKLFEGSAGVSERFTVETHTLRVLETYQKLNTKGLPIALGGKVELTKKDMRLFLLLHDIGKSAVPKNSKGIYTSKNLELRYNTLVMNKVCKALGVDRRKQLLFRALLSNDTLGQFLMGKINLVQAEEEIRKNALQGKVDPGTFLMVMTIYHKSDAASYGRVMHRYFIESDDNLEYQKQYQEKYSRLQEQLSSLYPHELKHQLHPAGAEDAPLLHVTLSKAQGVLSSDITAAPRGTLIALRDEILSSLQNYETQQMDRNVPQYLEMKRMAGIIEDELNLRNMMEKSYREEEEKLITSPIESDEEAFDQLISSYMRIPEADRPHGLPHIQQIVQLLIRRYGSNFNDLLLFLNRYEGSNIVLYRDILYAYVEIHLNQESLLSRLTPKQLCDMGEQLSMLYKQLSPPKKRHAMQMTAALAFRKAADAYLGMGNKHDALEVIELVSKRVSVNEENPLYSLKTAIKQYRACDLEIAYVNSGGLAIEKQRLRIASKEVVTADDMLTENNVRFTHEIQFELHPYHREQLTSYIDMLATLKEEGILDGIQIEKVPFQYNLALEPGKRFLSQAVEKGEKIGYMGDAWQITVPGVGTVCIGSDKQYWNHYHTVRVEIDGDRGQKAHQLLSLVGLPMAMMEPRPEDITGQKLLIALENYNPEAAYENDPYFIRETIAALPTMTEKIENEAQEMRMKKVWRNHQELVNPNKSLEAWQEGGRAFGAMVTSSSTKELAKIIPLIFKNGYAPSLERFRQGIFSLGCAPVVNNRQGSADSCFVRPLPNRAFNQKFKFNDYPNLLSKTAWGEGRAFLLFDITLAERNPIYYPCDYSGSRSPYVQFSNTSKYHPKKWVDTNLKSYAAVKQRKGHKELFREQNVTYNHWSEATIDAKIDEHYLYGIVVGSEKDRQQIILSLKAQGISELKGRKIEECIYFSESLKPEMVYNPFVDKNRKSLKGRINVVNIGKESVLSGKGWSEQVIEEGITLHQFQGQLMGKNQRINIMRMDPAVASNYELKIVDTKDFCEYNENPENYELDQRMVLSNIMEKYPDMLAIVNGGFFHYSHRKYMWRAEYSISNPVGMVKLGGHTRFPSLNRYLWGAVGTMGQKMKIVNSEVEKEKCDSLYDALGSAPVLIRNGIMTDLDARVDKVSQDSTGTLKGIGPYAPPGNYHEHKGTSAPRTIVAKDKDGGIMLITIDGKDRKHAQGMNLYEVQQLMDMLGTKDALNLDGGGSTEMVARIGDKGSVEIINKPCDKVGQWVPGTNQRPVPTAIGFAKKNSS